MLVQSSSSQTLKESLLLMYTYCLENIVVRRELLCLCVGEGTEKGKVLGIVRSIGALGRAIGPFVACAVYWQYSACVCYMLGAALLSLPLSLLLLSDTQPTKLKHS